MNPSQWLSGSAFSQLLPETSVSQPREATLLGYSPDLLALPPEVRLPPTQGKPAPFSQPAAVVLYFSAFLVSSR